MEGGRERGRERRRQERDICHLLAHSPNGHNRQSWARLKPGAFPRLLTWVARVIFLCFSQGAGLAVRTPTGILIQDASITGNGLTWYATRLAGPTFDSDTLRLSISSGTYLLILLVDFLIHSSCPLLSCLVFLSSTLPVISWDVSK